MIGDSLHTMPPLLHEFDAHRKILLVTAAPKESMAALSGLEAPTARAQPWRLHAVNSRFDLLETGVGKSNAAGAAARCIDHTRHGAVINIGVGGALPNSGCEIGQVALATESVFGDEGLDLESGFQTIADIGFPLTARGVSIPASTNLFDLLRPIAHATGPIATISTCAASDRRAHEIRSRTGAIAEAMEGAAVGSVVERINQIHAGAIAFAEIRIISNRTGDRAAQGWDLDGALMTLSRVVASL